MLQQICDATKLANLQIIDYINNSLKSTDFEYDKVGFGGDVSSKMDLFCESIFVKHLSRFADIYSEESGFITSNSKLKIANSKFIIDPLDGSDNFLSNLPYYGSSVAFLVDGKIVFSMICNFVSQKLVYKINDKLYDDSFANPNKLAIFERAYAAPMMAKILYDKKIKFRSPGGVALSLANARNYKFVLFYGKIREFDLAAAMYINNDLNIFQNDEYLLMSKDKDVFEDILYQVKQIPTMNSR